MQKHLNLISYFGGKFPHLTWLINQFPKGNYHFIDLMCGSANVALNVNYPLVTINDINDEVVNLFKVLRDNYEEFLMKVYFTPFSRSELNSIIKDAKDNIQLDPVEKARRYFVKSQLGYGANGSQNDHYGCGFEWKLAKSNFYRVDNWNEKLKKLPQIVEKLRRMQIDSRCALDVFDSVNKPGNIIYIDPPYLMETRKSKKRYKHEVYDDFHYRLGEKIKEAKCFIAISGYDSDMYNELFNGLQKNTSNPSAANVGKVLRSEVLWTNYVPADVNNHPELKFE